ISSLQSLLCLPQIATTLSASLPSSKKEVDGGKEGIVKGEGEEEKGSEGPLSVTESLLALYAYRAHLLQGERDTPEVEREGEGETVESDSDDVSPIVVSAGLLARLVKSSDTLQALFSGPFQQDSAEFTGMLLSVIEAEIQERLKETEKGEGLSPLHSLLGVTERSIIKCAKCGHQRVTKDANSLALQVPIPGGISITSRDLNTLITNMGRTARQLKDSQAVEGEGV
ncbi:hypothetical protein KIPB_011153, partial [Kipferlia bialata]